MCLLNNTHIELVKGKGIIRTLDDLYRIIIDLETRAITVKNDFFDKNFTSTGFQEFCTEALKINKYLEFRFDTKYVSSYDSRVKQLVTLRDPEELISYIMHNKEKAFEVVKHISEYYLGEYTEVLNADSKLSTVQLELLDAESELVKYKGKYDKMLDKYEGTVEKLDTLIKRINFQYERDINPDVSDAIKITEPLYKKILYVKEITRVHYVDTMLTQLQEVLKTIHELPTRMVIIEAPYAYSRIDLYPGMKAHTDLTYSDVFSSDIFMAGFQKKIMDSVLNNPSKLEYLIILDRSGSKHPYIYGDNVEVLHTVSDMADIKTTTANTRLITYRSDTLHIPFNENYKDLSPQEAVTYYSSLDIVKAIVKLLEK